MLNSRRPKTSIGLLLFSFLGGLVFSGCSGDQYKTGTTVQQSPEAKAGAKASMEFMRSRMTKGGLTKK